MFQRRHFEEIAMVLAFHPHNPELNESFCQMFENDNLNFSRLRFLDAIKQDREVHESW